MSDRDLFELQGVPAPRPERVAWTTARRWALRQVIAGKVTLHSNRVAGTDLYLVAGEPRAAQPQPFRWLRDQLLVQLGPPRRTGVATEIRDVTVTEAGLAAGSRHGR